jgi:uncharacterized membrane protein
MTVWRQRLDTTSNWAIILIFSTSTLVLGGVSIPHFVMLLGLAIVSICLLIEARRYQRLQHSRWRLALFDHNYFAPMLWPQARVPEPYWRRQLACDLRRPHFTISWFMASRLRLRRNYLMLLYFCTGVWLTKVIIHPQSPRNFGEFYARLAVGDLFPSWFVASTACGFIAVASVLALLSPSDESLDHWTRERVALRPDVQSSGALTSEEERVAGEPSSGHSR